jgi:DNA relaxase NicK
VIIFDWLSFTTTKVQAEQMIDFLELNNVQWVTSYKKAHDYPVRYYFDGIHIHFGNPNYDMVWVEMCGQGCRAFEKYSKLKWYKLLKKVLKIAHNITRFDVAFDDFHGLLDMKNIHWEAIAGNYVSIFESYAAICSNKGITVEIGSVSSDIMFTIYDKAAEQAGKCKENEKKQEILSKHWVRFEMQLRDERAREFIQNLFKCPLGELFGGVLNKYLRFVTPNKSDSNKKRWNSRKWWTKFVNTAKIIKLNSKGKPNYNLEKCEDFVYGHCGNAISTLIDIQGIEKFQTKLKQKKSEFVHEKYSSLVSEYGRFEEKPEPEPQKIIEKPVYMYRCDICGLFKPETQFAVHDRKTGAGNCSSCLNKNAIEIINEKIPPPRPVKPKKLPTLADVRLKEQKLQWENNPLYQQWFENQEKNVQ